VPFGSRRDRLSRHDRGAQQVIVNRQQVLDLAFKWLGPFVRYRPAWTNGEIGLNNKTRVDGMALKSQIIKQSAEDRADTLRGCGCSEADPDCIANGTNPAYEDRDESATVGRPSERCRQDSQGSGGRRSDSF